jgi:hypothetical protein
VPTSINVAPLFVEFHLEGAVGRLQIGNALLRVGLLQLKGPATQGAQIKAHILRYLLQRFRIHHANR